MTGGAALAAYAANDVLAMSPAQRVVFLYRHLVVGLRRAQRCLLAGDVEGRSDHLCRAQAIVQELLVSLNRDAGGDLADRLAALYGYFGAEIIGIDQQRDATRLERLITMVSPLLVAWELAGQEVGEPQGKAASA